MRRSWFRFPKTRKVFFLSMSLISGQLLMRDNVPSWLTTTGPRWSSCTVEPPPLISSFVVSPSPFCSGAGRVGRDPIEESDPSCWAGSVLVELGFGCADDILVNLEILALGIVLDRDIRRNVEVNAFSISPKAEFTMTMALGVLNSKLGWPTVTGWF